MTQDSVVESICKQPWQAPVGEDPGMVQAIFVIQSVAQDPPCAQPQDASAALCSTASPEPCAAMQVCSHVGAPLELEATLLVDVALLEALPVADVPHPATNAKRTNAIHRISIMTPGLLCAKRAACFRTLCPEAPWSDVGS
jgi:hypothetical protein